MESPNELFHFSPPLRGLRRFLSPARKVLNRVGAAGMTLATLGYARHIAPFRVHYPQVPMALPDLPPAFEGFRLVQITDLHTGRNTSVGFLRRVIERVNQMNPDLVCVTGDLVSSRLKWVQPVCDLLAQLRAPVVATFGNHDYAVNGEPWTGTELADTLERALTSRNITVLRNRALPLERAGGRIWLVGLDDFWAKGFSPQKAFASVNRDEPIIALSHNPDTVFVLEHHGADWILAGHTHGGQIRLPILGGVLMPVRHKQFDGGEFRVGRSRLYVCRGVGYRLQVRFRCPPEVPCFVLRRQA